MKIAIYRNDNIGDLLITLPFIHALREHFIGAQIILYGNKQTAAVAGLINLIDVFRDVATATVETIRSEAIDMCFFVGPVPPAALEKLFVDAEIPVRVAMRDHDSQHALTCRIDGPRTQDYGHVALNDFKMLTQFGIPEPSLATIKQNQYRHIKTASLTPYFDADLRYIVLHTKSNKNGKEWPTAYFNEVKKQLLAAGTTVVFTGTANEKNEALADCADLLAGDCVIDSFGNTTMLEFTRILKFSQAVLCSGTGPLHLAAALDVKTIGLFPPYLEGNVKRWDPLGRHTVIIEGTGGCKKPWYKPVLKHRQCNKVGASCLCMQKIDVAMVMALI